MKRHLLSPSVPHHPIWSTPSVSVLLFLLSFSAILSAASEEREIWFGTPLKADSVVLRAQTLAASLVDSSAPNWQAKGDQRRTYYFAETSANEPYRINVPESWDGTSPLTLVMFLHGGGSNESVYLDMNSKQMLRLSNEHEFLLVSPKGTVGAYGNFLRLSAPFGNEAGARELMAQATPEIERNNRQSEQDVLNVLELVLHEYPVDRSSMFLAGHSMGSGGTWYIGGKYRQYWNAIAPMSGPFVQETGYPWDSLHQMSFFITEGIQTPSLPASRVLRDWMTERDFNLKYKEVNADHGDMIPLVLPDVFDFFEANIPVTKSTPPVTSNRHCSGVSLHYSISSSLKITVPVQHSSPGLTIDIVDMFGRKWYSGSTVATDGIAHISGILFHSGTHILTVTSGVHIWHKAIVITQP